MNAYQYRWLTCGETPREFIQLRNVLSSLVSAEKKGRCDEYNHIHSPAVPVHPSSAIGYTQRIWIYGCYNVLLACELCVYHQFFVYSHYGSCSDLRVSVFYASIWTIRLDLLLSDRCNLTFYQCHVYGVGLTSSHRRVHVEEIGHKGQVEFAVSSRDVTGGNKLSAVQPGGLPQHQLGPLKQIRLLHTHRKQTHTHTTEAEHRQSVSFTLKCIGRLINQGDALIMISKNDN